MLSVLKVRQAVQYFAVAASKMCGSVLDQCEIRCLKVVAFFFFIWNDKVHAKSMIRDIDMKEKFFSKI